MEIARHTINVNGRLLELSEPQVMGIVNITPDSFFAESRKQSEQDIVERVETILAEGGSMVDVGACSTRPGAQVVSEEEERARLQFALQVIRSHFPDAVLSVDTFRPSIARMAVSDYGVAMINDVGDPGVPRQEMFSMMGQ
ncbi:MAG: dihydropteroate synthase, partial [Prevotella sp.]|nr:dihydropteroate synthase [Prevotella sp.]